MEKKRSFSEMKKKMSFNEFNNFCKKLTEDYANSEGHFARSYFCSNHNISESCFYRILEHAVVTNLVDEIVFSKMLAKAKSNQKAHSSKAGGTTEIKFRRMYTERCKFIATSIQNEEVEKVAKQYAYDLNLTKNEIARSNGLPVKVLDYVLLRSIEECIVDDDTFKAMEKRSLSGTRPEKLEYTKDFFAGLQKKRLAFKRNIKTV